MKINPLRGTALFVIDPKLVFALVDNFFGGVGRQAKIEGREFTATEMRVVHMFLRSAFADMKEAWTPIAQIDVEYVNSEINPNFAGIVTPSEVVVVCPFQIDLDGGGGSLHVVMPYSMIEPLREVLDSGVQSDRAEQDERWLTLLKDGLQDAEVELTTLLGNGSVALSTARGSQARRRVALRLHRQGHGARRRRAAVPRRFRRVARPAMRPLRTEIPPRNSKTQLEELEEPMNAKSEAVAADEAEAQDVNLEVILDVPVTLSMEVGRTRIPIRNLLQLNQGSVVELDRAAGEPLDVFVNGTLVAHGEVVVVNEKFGIRITDVVSPAERIRKLK